MTPSLFYITAGLAWITGWLVQWPAIHPSMIRRYVPLAATTIGGILLASAMHDPGWVVLGGTTGWAATPWWDRRVGRLRLRRALQKARPFLQAVQEALDVGNHPLTAIALATHHLPPSDRETCERTLQRLAQGRPFDEAMSEWERRTAIPSLRLFASFCRAWSTWGVDLSHATGRLVRELEAQERAQAEVLVVRAAHEWLSWVFIALTMVIAVVSVATWPRHVPAPWETAWGRGLFTAMFGGTLLAFWLPDTLSEDLDDMPSRPGPEGHIPS